MVSRPRERRLAESERGRTAESAEPFDACFYRFGSPGLGRNVSMYLGQAPRRGPSWRQRDRLVVAENDAEMRTEA